MIAPLAVAEWGGPDQPFQPDARTPLLHLYGRSFSHNRLWNDANGRLGFYGWLRVVNRRIEKTVIVGLKDLPDRCWRDEYNIRVPPGEAADLAIGETRGRVRDRPAMREIVASRSAPTVEVTWHLPACNPRDGVHG